MHCAFLPWLQRKARLLTETILVPLQYGSLILIRAAFLNVERAVISELLMNDFAGNNSHQDFTL
jgi:hypothetical protein